MSISPTTPPLTPPPGRRRTADEYADRDRAMLCAILRYQVLVGAMASAQFLNGKEAGHVLRRFAAKGWLELETAAIPGGVTYATLTAAGGREIGVTHRVRPMSAARLDAALAVGGFCLLDADCPTGRVRLTAQEINRIDAGLAANVPHVLTDEFVGDDEDNPSAVLLRVVVAATGKPKVVCEKVAEVFRKAVANPKCRPFVTSGDLGIAILGHTPQRVAQLKDAIGRDKRFAGERVFVGLGPTSESLAAVSLRRPKR